MIHWIRWSYDLHIFQHIEKFGFIIAFYFEFLKFFLGDYLYHLASAISNV